MYDQSTLHQIKEWRDAWDLRPIGRGTTSSFIGTLPNGEEAVFKRRDESFDEAESNYGDPANWSWSSVNEVAWFVVTQILGGEWRKVPPCHAVRNWNFDAEQFRNHEDIPSTSTYFDNDGAFKKYMFTGTVHWYQERCTHDPNDVGRGTDWPMWADYIRLRILDSVLHHVDRHPMNVLIDLDLVTADDGTPRMYWIDNGRSFVATGRSTYEQMCKYWRGTLPRQYPARCKQLIYKSATQIMDKWWEICNALDTIGARTEVLDDSMDMLDMICKQTATKRLRIPDLDELGLQYEETQYGSEAK